MNLGSLGLARYDALRGAYIEIGAVDPLGHTLQYSNYGFGLFG